MGANSVTSGKIKKGEIKEDDMNSDFIDELVPTEISIEYSKMQSVLHPIPLFQRALKLIQNISAGVLMEKRNSFFLKLTTSLKTQFTWAELSIRVVQHP